MKLFAKTEYACIAMLMLAQRYASGEVARVRDLAQVHEIPERFLVQILLQLKSAGLVQSTRGATGGYRLARRPELITLDEVMKVVEGSSRVEAPLATKSAVLRVLQKVWREAAQQQHSYLHAQTLAKLLERCQGEQQEMYYI